MFLLFSRLQFPPAKKTNYSEPVPRGTVLTREQMTADLDFLRLKMENVHLTLRQDDWHLQSLSPGEQRLRYHEPNQTD